jgi:hypothetical protein
LKVFFMNLHTTLTIDTDICRAARTVVAATAASLGLHGTCVQAQPLSTLPAPSTPYEAALNDYLLLLGQIAPAAQLGAQDYLQAYALRCGRRLDATELRKAMADGDGDPVLMAMIRARHLRSMNGGTAHRVMSDSSAQIVCTTRSKQ